MGVKPRRISEHLGSSHVSEESTPQISLCPVFSLTRSPLGTSSGEVSPAFGHANANFSGFIDCIKN